MEANNCNRLARVCRFRGDCNRRSLHRPEVWPLRLPFAYLRPSALWLLVAMAWSVLHGDPAPAQVVHRVSQPEPHARSAQDTTENAADEIVDILTLVDELHSDPSDMIMRVGAFPQTYENMAGGMELQGIELENRWQLSEKLRWIGSVTYRENVPDGVHDTSHVPNWMARMGAACSMDNGWSVGIFDTFYGDPSSVTVVNPAASIVNPVPRAYHLISLNATVDLDTFFHWYTGRSTRLQFLMQNLLNERIDHREFSRRSINSLPGEPGRTFYGGVSIEYSRTKL